MKRVSGTALARELARRNPLLPVILMTGYPTPDLAAEGRLILRKPVGQEALSTACRQAIDGGATR